MLFCKLLDVFNCNTKFSPHLVLYAVEQLPRLVNLLFCTIISKNRYIIAAPYPPYHVTWNTRTRAWSCSHVPGRKVTWRDLILQIISLAAPLHFSLYFFSLVVSSWGRESCVLAPCQNNIYINYTVCVCLI